MAVSQNGWLANTRSVIQSYKVPGGKIAMRKGDVATILVYVAKRFDSEVEPLVWPGNWGYAERPIRGGSSLSNHASGTAIDLNAPQHPLGTQPTANFSSSQIRKIKKIVSDCGGTIRWGGSYSGRKDGMHFEINAGSARVREVARAIRAGKKPGPAGGAEQSGGGGGSSYGNSDARYEVGSRVMRKFSSGTDVEWLQKRLYKLGHDLTFDGDFGPNVEKAVRAEQKKAKISVDGEVYTETIKALKAAEVVRGLPKGSSAAKPKGKVPGKKYAFPYESGGYIGPLDGPNHSHSGIGGRKTGGVLDRTWNKRFVNQLEARGWDPEGDYLVKFGNDGKYGDELEELIRAFQRDQGLPEDGLGGDDTWTAAFENPVT